MSDLLPVPGGDDGSWAPILNDYLLVSLNEDGTLQSNENINAVVRGAAAQDAPRRGGSVQPQVSEGMTHYGLITALTNVSTTITVTTTLQVAVGELVNIASVTGFATNNPNGNWVVVTVTITGFTAVVVNAPTGSYGGSGIVSVTRPVIDVVLGDSIPYGEGAGTDGVGGKGVTDQFTVLSSMENRAAGLIDPGLGFRRCHAPFFTADTWTSLAVGSEVTASGPIANYDTSWQLTSSGQVIGNTQVFRRAVVILKRRTNGDGVQVSFNGGSSFTATLDTNGSGYFMVDSGDLGAAVSGTVQVAWESAVSGSGGAGVEVAGVRLYQTNGQQGAYVDNIAAGGSWALNWVTNTDWDTYWLPMVQPRRVVICCGVNDLASGQTLSQLQASLTSLVVRAQAGAPLAEVVLVAEYHPGNTTIPYNTGITGANWNAQFVTMVAQIALTEGCTFVDLFARFGDVSTRSGDSGDPYGLTQGNLGTTGDGTHFGDNTRSTSGRDGQRAIAENYWEKLSYSHPYQQHPSPGWTADPVSWSQFSGTVFVMFNNPTLYLAPGTKLRWTESGVVKYGVVASSSFTAGGGSVTMIPTSDYAMTVTPDPGSNWYSYSEPPDFPSAFTWSNIAATGWSGTPTVVASYSVTGRRVSVTGFISGTSSSANSTCTAPVASAVNGPAFASCAGEDNGASTVANVGIATSSSTINLLKGASILSGTWTASGTKVVTFQLEYGI